TSPSPPADPPPRGFPMRHAFGFVSVAVVLVLARACYSADEKQEMTEDEKAVVALTNAERAKKNLPPLKPNPILSRVARGHSANMAKQNKGEHELDGKMPKARTKEAGYDPIVVGENIGWGDWTDKQKWTAARMMDWWMKSDV